MRRIGIISAIALVAGTSLSYSTLAQQAPNPPAAAPCSENCPAKEVQTSYARVKGWILKSANETPAEDYSFKPTPDIRTFARVVNHVTEAQAHICGAINGSKPDAITVPPETADKATIVAALNASFAECDKAYASVIDTNMTEMITLGPVKRSRIGLLWGNFAHDDEQYATLALYMRLKGLTPPSSEK